MACNHFNDYNILEQLRDGTAKFEVVSSPVPSISHIYTNWNSSTRLFGVGNCSSNLFFARIGSSHGGQSPAMKKLERFSVQKVTGDGRCLFRALVKGMPFNKGVALNQHEERENADSILQCMVFTRNNMEKRIEGIESQLAELTKLLISRSKSRNGRPRKRHEHRKRRTRPDPVVEEGVVNSDDSDDSNSSSRSYSSDSSRFNILFKFFFL